MKHNTARYARKIRHLKIRKTLWGTSQRPRLVVFRSNRNFYAQIINDQIHHTLVAVSTLNLHPKPKNTNLQTMATLGAKLAAQAQANNITQVVFDRAGYLFHGQVAAFAKAVRAAGIKF